jgi:hypothetical protein
MANPAVAILPFPRSSSLSLPVCETSGLVALIAKTNQVDS